MNNPTRLIHHWAVSATEVGAGNSGAPRMSTLVSLFNGVA